VITFLVESSSLQRRGDRPRVGPLPAGQAARAEPAGIDRRETPRESESELKDTMASRSNRPEPGIRPSDLRQSGGWTPGPGERVCPSAARSLRAPRPGRDARRRPTGRRGRDGRRAVEAGVAACTPYITIFIKHLDSEIFSLDIGCPIATKWTLVSCSPSGRGPGDSGAGPARDYPETTAADARRPARPTRGRSDRPGILGPLQLSREQSRHAVSPWRRAAFALPIGRPGARDPGAVVSIRDGRDRKVHPERLRIETRCSIRTASYT
jgi:hypothetical protein